MSNPNPRRPLSTVPERDSVASTATPHQRLATLDRFSIATATTIDTSPPTPPSPSEFDDSPEDLSTLPLERPRPGTHPRTDPHQPPPSPGTARLTHFSPNPIPALRRAHSRLVIEDYHNITRAINDELRPPGEPAPPVQPRRTPKESGDPRPMLHRLKSTSELYGEAQKEIAAAPPSYSERGNRRVTSGQWFSGGERRTGEGSSSGERRTREGSAGGGESSAAGEGRSAAAGGESSAQGEQPRYWGGRQWGKSAAAQAVMRTADKEWWAEHEAIHGPDDDAETSREERG